MNKQNFLSELKKELQQLPQSEVNEILRDQEEYIIEAIKSGRKEEEVINSIGRPKDFARSLIAENLLAVNHESDSILLQFKNVLRILILFVALAPLNIILFLGPFFVVCLALLLGWIFSGAFLITSIALIIGFFVKLSMYQVGFWVHLSSFFFIIGCVGLGILAIYFVMILSKFVLDISLNYLRWNLNLIKLK